jgi:hypothetical protein
MLKSFTCLASINDTLVYDIPFITMEKLWQEFYERAIKSRASTAQELEAIVHVFHKQWKPFPLHQLQEFCAEKLKHAYALTNNEQDKLPILYDFCNALLGNTFTIYVSLCDALTLAIDNYDNHTGLRGLMTNRFQGENIYLTHLRKLHLELRNNPVLHYQAYYEKFSGLRRILAEKEKTCPTRTPLSLLDKSFQLLRIELQKWEQTLKEIAPPLYAWIVTQEFLGRFSQSVLPIRIVTNITQQLYERDIASIKSTIGF